MSINLASSTKPARSPAQRMRAYRRRRRYRRLNVRVEVDVIGLGDVNGKPLAWCQWIDANEDTRRTTFPEGELIKRP